MAQSDTSQLLNEIYTQRRDNPLNILSLAEPILAPETQFQSHPLSQSQNGSSRDSPDHQNATLSPLTLSADLQHYRHLFSKLRFSYLEQVTKEKYIRSVAGEPPILATSEENAALEDRLAVMKSELKAKKLGVEALVQEMEDLAREIAEKYDGVNASVALLETLPGEVESLESEVEELRRQLAEKEGEVERSEDPRMNLSLEETDRLLQEQRRKNEDLARQISEVEKEMPGKVRDCEKAERELEEIEKRRNEITKLVRDAQRTKEQGGRDLLEEQGRWYKSSEIVLKGLLGV
ncbi:hypothetical protein OHC33_008407 [Knufia fluminis]|uniref:Kinetochore protein Sos7 coiled-coil domain-containing protein n=1 Tax=Knufia fluminis TaxID=191047 RepID=A0AAN8I3K2_9EURO|nr:hypothetical protein OHC33_008407 [Knufia fluminis]